MYAAVFARAVEVTIAITEEASGAGVVVVVGVEAEGATGEDSISEGRAMEEDLEAGTSNLFLILHQCYTLFVCHVNELKRLLNQCYLCFKSCHVTYNMLQPIHV